MEGFPFLPQGEWTCLPRQSALWWERGASFGFSGFDAVCDSSKGGGSSHLKAQKALVLRTSERRILDRPPSGLREPPDLGTVQGVETIGWDWRDPGLPATCRAGSQVLVPLLRSHWSSGWYGVPEHSGPPNPAPISRVGWKSVEQKVLTDDHSLLYSLPLDGIRRERSYFFQKAWAYLSILH